MWSVSSGYLGAYVRSGLVVLNLELAVFSQPSVPAYTFFFLHQTNQTMGCNAIADRPIPALPIMTCHPVIMTAIHTRVAEVPDIDDFS